MTNDANKITERKKAVWYHNEDEGTLTCSWCISEFDDDIMKYWNNIPNFCPNCGSEMQWCDCVDEVETHDNGANSQLMKLSKRYPSAQQWIPCSERLPEVGQTVITSSALGRVREATYRGSYAWEIHGVVHWTDEILSWRPLPNISTQDVLDCPSAQPEDWMERNKERILQAGMEGREIEFRIGGRLFAIREKAQ